MIIDKNIIENPVNNSIEEPVNNIVNSLVLKPEEYNISPIIDQQPSTSTISPEHIKPYSKAKLQEKMNKKGSRKKGKSAILTDTPEKLFIEQGTKITTKRSLNFKNNSCKKRKIKKQKKVNKKNDDDSDDEDETFCLVCTDLYINSLKGESWIQCIKCKLWAHGECTNQMYMPLIHVKTVKQMSNILLLIF